MVKVLSALFALASLFCFGYVVYLIWWMRYFTPEGVFILGITFALFSGVFRILHKDEEVYEIGYDNKP